MNTSVIAFQNVAYDLQTQEPPFPITSDPGATLSYHLKPGGHSFASQPWGFKSPRSFEQEQGWDICFK